MTREEKIKVLKTEFDKTNYRVEEVTDFPRYKHVLFILVDKKNKHTKEIKIDDLFLDAVSTSAKTIVVKHLG